MCSEGCGKPLEAQLLLWVSWPICEWFLCDSASLWGREKAVMACIYFVAVSGPQSSPLPRRLGSQQAPAFLSPPELLFLLFSLRIKGWWVSHHYVSTFLSGVMLTW